MALNINSITAVNSVYMLAIAGLYPVPQQLQGFMADAAFETEAADIAEVVLGVDGRMSAGFIPYLTRQTISIMADSDSSLMFENWVAAQKVIREIYWASATIMIPAVGRKYTCSQGVLTSFPAINPVHKVLQGRQFVITWGSVDPALF